MGCVGSAMVNPVQVMGERNVVIRYQEEPTDQHQKKLCLCRLPHFFSCVLELPFTPDAIVAVEEDPSGFRFVASADRIEGEVQAHVIHITPNVVRIVILDELDSNLLRSGLPCADESRWRFRLPESNPLWPQPNMKMESLL